MSPRSIRTPTKKDLESLVEQLQASLTLEAEQRTGLAGQLEAAQLTIQQLRDELAAALAQVAQARADADAEVAAAAAQVAAATAAAAAAAAPLVPKPPGVVRDLQNISGLSTQDYRAVQRTIRNLVVMAGLDVTEDFRRQNTERLSQLYKAAREEHPVLRRFQNNWVTAELAKQFLQNRRKHAVRRGYLDRNLLKTGARTSRHRSPSEEI